MANITYKCPACGGALRYNPSDRRFNCEYCGSSFDDVDIKEKEAAREIKTVTADTSGAEGESTIYTCPSCGAELVTDETTAATQCYFCHNPVVLTGRLSAEWKPDSVLPFTVDRETAKAELSHWIRKHRYVPADFKSEKNLDSITGIYYPYWLADYDADASFEGEGIKVSTSTTPSYIITTRHHYRVERRGMIKFKNIQRSALGKADHKLADGVQPYRYDELKSFNNSYLSGFFAEKRDIERGEVSESVESECKGYVKSLLTRDCAYATLTGSAEAKFTGSDYRYTLLPAWIMTYRNKRGDNKTYYYAMNGQTKAVCGMLPVDKKKLLLHSGILFGVITLLMLLGGYFIW
jgi:DNA-directed RNA polymerase subunit RPC12/RpoP